MVAVTSYKRMSWAGDVAQCVLDPELDPQLIPPGPSLEKTMPFKDELESEMSGVVLAEAHTLS